MQKLFDIVQQQYYRAWENTGDVREGLNTPEQNQFEQLKEPEFCETGDELQELREGLKALQRSLSNRQRNEQLALASAELSAIKDKESTMASLIMQANAISLKALQNEETTLKAHERDQDMNTMEKARLFQLLDAKGEKPDVITPVLEKCDVTGAVEIAELHALIDWVSCECRLLQQPNGEASVGKDCREESTRSSTNCREEATSFGWQLQGNSQGPEGKAWWDSAVNWACGVWALAGNTGNSWCFGPHCDKQC